MRNRVVAGILAICFGIFGADKYYLGEEGSHRWIMTLFGLGIISFIMGLINGIKLLEMSQSQFDNLYNGGKCSDVATLLNRNVDGVVGTKIEKKEGMPDF